MNELMLFDNENFGQVRIGLINGEPWFVGRDAVERLAYDLKSHSYTTYINKYILEEDIKKLNNPDARLFGIENAGRKGEILINEYGLYDLIMSSPLPQAKEFKKWVTHEVLPSIRKTGNYSLSNNLPTEVNQMLDCINKQQEQIDKLLSSTKEQQSQIDEIKQLVGIRAKQTFNYSQLIKNHLGIDIINEDYRIIKEMFFVDRQISKWEDLSFDVAHVKRLKDICNQYKTPNQISFFD